MNTTQIEYIRSLDPLRIDGTIQSVLMSENLNEVSFERVLKLLLEAVIREKKFLVSQNIKFSNSVLKIPE